MSVTARPDGWELWTVPRSVGPGAMYCARPPGGPVGVVAEDSDHARERAIAEYKNRPAEQVEAHLKNLRESRDNAATDEQRAFFDQRIAAEGQ